MAGTRFRRVHEREVRLKNPFSILILILRVRTFRKKVPAFRQYSDTLSDHDDDCDGWSNGLEALVGTDPTSADSPPDGILRSEVEIIHDVSLDLDNNGIP
jgi:hypothetical protein